MHTYKTQNIFNTFW